MHYYFITGTSRGIGKALAEILLENPENDITGFARADEIEYTPNYAHVHADFNKPESIVGYDFPELPDAESIVLFNNAGTMSQIFRLGKMDNKKIINDFNVNIISASVLANSFMKAYQHYTVPRTIINVSSGAARRPIDAWSTYCAAKSALDMLNETINLEQNFYPEQNRIKSFSVAPGVIDTRLQDQIREVSPEEFSDLQRFIDLKINNELCTPEHAAFLLLQVVVKRDSFTKTLLDVREL